jgi:hypothetical protein
MIYHVWVLYFQLDITTYSCFVIVPRTWLQEICRTNGLMGVTLLI